MDKKRNINDVFEVKNDSGLIFTLNPFYRNLSGDNNCFHLVISATSGMKHIENTSTQVFVILMEKSLSNQPVINHDYEAEL